ncbi:hypothetical protein [Thermococcus sp. MV5]|uniref:hypothetical protein n=1 Tax=Thermococcus sp. MV5 TaxID=1638272 RepID=UPI00143B003D|nr:hypothetical protein [Thermococcus sp. MV5]
MDEVTEKYKSVAILIQFDASSMINIVVEDSDSNAKELSEIAKNLAFEIAKKFGAKVR